MVRRLGEDGCLGTGKYNRGVLDSQDCGRQEENRSSDHLPADFFPSLSRASFWVNIPGRQENDITDFVVNNDNY